MDMATPASSAHHHSKHARVLACVLCQVGGPRRAIVRPLLTAAAPQDQMRPEYPVLKLPQGMSVQCCPALCCGMRRGMCPHPHHRHLITHLICLARSPQLGSLTSQANVTCTPSTPAPARKRRRPNQDLQERLARCEVLLKQYAGGTAPDLTAQSPLTPSTTNGSQSDNSVFTPTSGDIYMKWKPTGKMIKEEGGVRFMDSYLWASVYDELQAMRDIVDTDDPEDSSVLGSEDLTPENHTDLFFPGDASTANLEELQPDPVHVFRLWQLFLDRVNPLTKIIHVPTLQPYVMEAATNMSNIPLNYQALLFAIFNMAAVSLTDVECIQMLGMSREHAVKRFTAGTKIALNRFNFLKHYHMAALQALVLHLVRVPLAHSRSDR